MVQNRREFLANLAKATAAPAISGLFPAIDRALALPANRRTGTIQDVEHIVILTQENRSFDHYFGSLGGVRGFADPFPIPVPDREGIQKKSVWYQPSEDSRSRLSPFHLNTAQNFGYIRVEGTPHVWADAQWAWDQGRMHRWTLAKRNHSLGYFEKNDIPFQWALANAFTICDAYHCSIQAGTNPNRLFIWTGTNDPLARGNGPATYNDYDWFDADPGRHRGYSWTTFPERLEGAGISWQVYENMADNFTDNPLAGFQKFRDAWFQRPGYSQALRERGVSTRDLDALASDVRANRLPQVSWIVATAEGSEHPGPSSPAQGADYIAKVLNALTANPEVWSKTVLFINFDENDGFFDHMPPPAPPSAISWNSDPSRRVLAGASTLDATDEYHQHLVPYHSDANEQALRHRPYGLGPRVPLYVVSPWSKGGWVNSQVFDHTSLLRFVEARFGVSEPNISSWRRAMCGDLTSAFDFAKSEAATVLLPDTIERAARARALSGHSLPPIPTNNRLPVQESVIRPSRGLPYELQVTSRVLPDAKVELLFESSGDAGAVFHVYDRLRLSDVPRRYTVEAGKSLRDLWAMSSASYDLWVLGPNGFHRHFFGILGSDRPRPDIEISYDKMEIALRLKLTNAAAVPAVILLSANRYYETDPMSYEVPANGSIEVSLPLQNGPWYDFSIRLQGSGDFGRRFAGRIENGEDSFSDPAMAGLALVDQFRF